MPILKETARSVEEFIQVISKLEKNWRPWFRGQANAEWPLLPRLYRSVGGAKQARRSDKKVREDDDVTREQFSTRAPILSDIKPGNKWDWYFTMQHHGARTRLLDWTEGSLIGLFFAVLENEGYHDAAVWAFDPWKLNSKVVGKREVIPPADPGITKKDRNRYGKWLHDQFAERKKWPRPPMAIFPSHIIRRMAVQRSCFTIHGWDRRGFEAIAQGLRVPLAKVMIPSWAVGTIQRTLESCGIDEATVFPDLEGLGRYFSATDDKLAEQSLPHHFAYTRLRPSKIDKKGVGVFAIRKIRKGTKIFRGDNDEMSWVEESRVPRRPKSIWKLYDDFPVRRRDPHDKKKKKRYGCPANFNRLTISWYLNESKRPNVRCDPEYFNFFALTDIEPGEELSVDYSTYSE